MKLLKIAIQFIAAFLFQHFVYIFTLHFIVRYGYNSEHGFNMGSIKTITGTYLYSVVLYNSAPFLNLITLGIFNFKAKRNINLIEAGAHAIIAAYLAGVLIWACLFGYGIYRGSIEESWDYEKYLFTPTGPFLISFIFCNLIFIPIYAYCWKAFIKDWINRT